MNNLTGKTVPIEFVATSRLPTAFGEFKITVFQDPKTGEEHVALSKGLEQAPTEPVLVRVHSVLNRGCLCFIKM